MKTDALVPPVTTRVRFSLSDRFKVPEQPGCYALASHDGDVLYVGLATNLRRRLRDHRESDEKRAAAKGRRADWFHFALCAGPELPRVERGWMNQYETLHGELPPMNKVYSPLA